MEIEISQLLGGIRELRRLAVQAVAARTQRLGHAFPGLREEVALEEHADRVEAAAVDLAGAEAADGFQVLAGGIALVLVEAVLREAVVQRAHLGVTRGL